MIRRLALVLAAGLPLAAAAQTPPAPAADPAPAAAPAAATVDLGGWLVFNSFVNFGGTNATDLPQRAAPLRSEVVSSMQVRQSRVRAVLGLPGGGLLGDAKLKGLVEIDFAGGAVGGDQSLPLLRLRHAYASATWKERSNLTLTLGQTWGIFTGPYFAASLGHLAVPRFAGAGFLFRRAPQVRLSGDAGGDVGFVWAAALLAPMDKATAPTASVTSGAGVGERSGLPDIEARAAVVVRRDKKNVVEVGVSAHYGVDRYLLNPGTTATSNTNKGVASSGISADAKLDLPYVTLLGSAFSGQNLDIWFTMAPGVVVTGGATPTDVTAVKTKGGWAQAQVNVNPRLQLLLGAGGERPDKTTIPTSTAAAPVIKKNGQLSWGAIVNLAPKWRLGAEYTKYVTVYNDAALTTYVASQIEVSTLYAF